MTSSGIGLSRRSPGIGTFLSAPLLWLVLALVPLVLLLSVPVSVAIGPMYWDTFLYLDAAQRIAMGQVPIVDFSAPVGPLSYYLFAWGLDLFPHAQPLLLAQWCMMAITGPLMAVVLAEVSARHRGLAFALLVPFLVFAIAPSNARVYHPFGGLEGVGLYNRHGVLLLYVLTSGLVFLKGGRKLVWFAALAMLALFLSKVTAFLAGGLIGIVALLAGRLSIRQVLWAGAIFAVPLAVSEVLTGFVSHYVGDILLLVGLNEDSLLSPFLTVLSGKLDVLLPAGLITLGLFWVAFRGNEQSLPFFDRSVWWFGAALMAGTIYETQNTGSQEYIFLWPIVLMIWQRLRSSPPRLKAIFLVLAAFTCVPTFSSVAHKSLRSVAAMITYDEVNAPIVRNMAQVAARPEILDRARLLLTHYPEFPATYEDLAVHNHLPSGQYYADLDIQLFWILSVASASQGVLDFEADSGVHLNSLMTLDFTNPFPWILNRDATRHIQIGAVADRTLPPLTPEIRAAVEATDGVMRGKCPATPGRTMIEEAFAEVLVGRVAVPVDPCWEVLVRPDLLPAQ